jgi:flagellar biosynthesis protein FlhF
MNKPVRIKTFRSKTLQEAFQKIRAEFGPDASILETKTSKSGLFGRSRIEVTASSQTNAFEIDNTESIQTDTRAPSPNQDRLKLGWESEPIGEALEGEAVDVINDSTSNVAEFASSRLTSGTPNEFAAAERVLGQVHQELLHAGIDPGIAEQWIGAARALGNPAVIKDVWTLRSELMGWIRDMVHAAPPLNIESSCQQVLAFVGPPGAGKSTTLAKIAAYLSMELGLEVGVLTTDNKRLGSNFLLHNYADILGWKFEVAETEDQVPICLSNLSCCRFVLLDTGGCSPDEQESIDQLGQILALVKPNETHLVLSSTCNVRTFLRYEQAFDALAPNRLVLTRLDESGGLGPLFSCLQSSGLPVSFLADGQKIPADLIQATELRLAQRVMDIA